MFINSQGSEFHKQHIKQLKQMCLLVHKTNNSSEYKYGEKIRNFKQNGIIRCVINRIGYRKLAKKTKKFSRSVIDYDPNYFSEHKIAVYTCVFGKYDSIVEPVATPDNIDYYIITDSNVSENSLWKKVDISQFEQMLKNMTNVEKNRWFKMHPEKVFSDYKYSVYIDGNVKPVTDFTEFVNRIGNCGVSMFWHSFNNCVYQEALFNKYSVRKIKSVEVDKQVEYLKSQNMPEDYGMTTCNVIAREHFNPICQKLMSDWWEEFINHCHRDQLSFPFVAWKNNIKMEDIAVLGNNVWDTDTLLVVQHK